MSRRKWVQIDGQLIEVDPKTYAPMSRGTVARYYVSDSWMDGTRSPIDGADIGSRTKLREHMRAHSVIDHAEAVQEASIQRSRSVQEFQRSRKQDLITALERTSAGYKPNIQEYRDE